MKFLVFDNRNGLGDARKLILNWDSVKYIKPSNATTFFIELNSGANIELTLSPGNSSEVIDAINRVVKANPNTSVLNVNPSEVGGFLFSSIVYNVAASGSIDGGGTANTIPVFIDANTIGDSALIQAPYTPGGGLAQMKMTDGYRFIIDRSSSVTAGDQEYAITQDNNSKVSFGWDDDGGGFGFLYNWAGFGWRIGAQGNNPMLEIVTTAGSESVNLHKQVEFKDYGSGTYSGTLAKTLGVTATGDVIEFDAAASTFDSGNSTATGRIRLGATASASSTSTDAVFIGSDLTNSNNDEQINIGHNNDGTGTQNMIYGSNNTQTGNGAYSILIGTLNQSAGNTSAAIGRQHNLATSNTYTIGQSNQSSFTGGVSSGGLMNVSIGYDNQLDVDKGAVFGFGNDVTGSFGWTIGGGNETVVIGNRLTMSLLGPNRSGSTGPRVIIATGEFIGASENKKNSVEYYTPEASRSGVFHPALYNSASYADDTAAAAGGVRLGELYRNGSVIQIRMT